MYSIVDRSGELVTNVGDPTRAHRLMTSMRRAYRMYLDGVLLRQKAEHDLTHLARHGWHPGSPDLNL